MFITDLNERLFSDCADDMDLMFILDSSGSIDDADFRVSVDFVVQVVEALDVPDPVRVATLIFENSPTTIFSFDGYSNKSQVLSAIHGFSRSKTRKESGEGGRGVERQVGCHETRVGRGVDGEGSKLAVPRVR